MDGSETTFSPSVPYKEGTLKVIFDGKLTYEFYEVYDAGNPPSEFTFYRAPSASREITISYYPADEQNTLNAVRYATPAQAKAQTRVTDLVSLGDSALDALIREAERLIDQYIAYPYRGYHGDVGQQLKFPRVKDEVKFYDSDRNVSDYVGIPQDVTMATIYAAENLMLLGDVVADSGVGDIVAESLGDYSYRLSESSGASSSDAAKLIGKRARSLVDKYRRATRSAKIGSANDGVLNSRQRFARDHY